MYLTYATSHGIVVVRDKQLRYETCIVPALSNNIAVFMQIAVTLDFCTAIYTIATRTVL